MNPLEAARALEYIDAKIAVPHPLGNISTGRLRQTSFS